MTIVEQLAAFVVRTGYDDLSEEVRRQLNVRVLDTVGCAIGALDIEPVKIIRKQIEDFGDIPRCSLICGGEEGEKFTVRTKEEADHSLPYLVAAVILDGCVMPPQFLPERVERNDIQTLLQKVKVRPLDEFSHNFPDEMSARIKITFKDGRKISKLKKDYEGFLTHPMTWETLVQKFEQLSQNRVTKKKQLDIQNAVANLEMIQVSELCAMLEKLK
jgi:2-methylcitrate dehydratase